MNQTKADIELGRFISKILRHNPAVIGITLDENGWADVDELIGGISKKDRSIDRITLDRIVRENNKNRYSYNADKTKIRANQGHSVAVDVELKKAAPPPVLYHGTAAKFVDSIKNNGITKQKRQHVHLSADFETAVNVGKRHGSPVVLEIDAEVMNADGFSFWISENNVWLCEEVPAKYILFK